MCDPMFVENERKREEEENEKWLLYLGAAKSLFPIYLTFHLRTIVITMVNNRIFSEKGYILEYYNYGYLLKDFASKMFFVQLLCAFL